MRGVSGSQWPPWRGSRRACRGRGTLGRSWTGPVLFQLSGVWEGRWRQSTLHSAGPRVLQGHGDAIAKVLRGEPSTSLLPGRRERGAARATAGTCPAEFGGPLPEAEQGSAMLSGGRSEPPQGQLGSHFPAARLEKFTVQEGQRNLRACSAGPCPLTRGQTRGSRSSGDGPSARRGQSGLLLHPPPERPGYPGALRDCGRGPADRETGTASPVINIQAPGGEGR